MILLPKPTKAHSSTADSTKLDNLKVKYHKNKSTVP